MKLKLTTDRFDSELIINKRSSTANADLILTMRLWFEPVNATSISDRIGGEFQTVPWDHAEFERFKLRACQVSTKVWNEKIWLQTPNAYYELDWPPPPAKATHRPNVHCGFRCVLAAGPAKAHFTVRAVKIRAQLRNSDMLPKTFRSYSNLWSSTVVDDLPTGAGFTQFGAAHEVGHLLGLAHIGYALQMGACTGQNDSNAEACYGIAKDSAPGSLANIMGTGNEVAEINSGPWRVQMAAHTEDKTSLTDWTPSRWRFPPRALNSIPGATTRASATHSAAAR